MEKTKETIAKVIKATAEKSLKRDANHTTCTIFFQPKVPSDLSKYKKAKK